MWQCTAVCSVQQCAEYPRAVVPGPHGTWHLVTWNIFEYAVYDCSICSRPICSRPTAGGAVGKVAGLQQ